MQREVDAAGCAMGCDGTRWDVVGYAARCNGIRNGWDEWDAMECGGHPRPAGETGAGKRGMRKLIGSQAFEGPQGDNGAPAHPGDPYMVLPRAVREPDPKHPTTTTAIIVTTTTGKLG